MSTLAIAAAALLVALLAFGMKEAGVKGQGAVLFGAGLCLLPAVIERLAPLLGFMGDLVGGSGIGPMAAVMAKVLGVGYVVHFSAEGCRENGAPALAAKVELCGKLEIFLLCLPYMRELFSLATDLVGG